MEFDGFDLSLEDSRATFLEQLEIMKKAWTEDDFTYQGQYFTVPRPITVLPRPLQKPHPQIWVACQSDQTVDWTAEQGYCPLFSGSPCSREQIRAGASASWRWLAAGHADPDPRMAVQRFVYVCDSEQEARDALWQTRWQRRVADHLKNNRERIVGRPQRGLPAADRVQRRGVVGSAALRDARARHRSAPARRRPWLHRLHRLVRRRRPAEGDGRALDAALRRRDHAALHRSQPDSRDCPLRKWATEWHTLLWPVANGRFCEWPMKHTFYSKRISGLGMKAGRRPSIIGTLCRSRMSQRDKQMVLMRWPQPQWQPKLRVRRRLRVTCPRWARSSTLAQCGRPGTKLFAPVSDDRTSSTFTTITTITEIL